MPDSPRSDELKDRLELEAYLREKAWNDPKFREALLADPRATLRQELQTISPGTVIPDGVELTVHEESLTHIHLVLPLNPASTELRDEELDLVAGGWGCGAKVCGCQSQTCDKDIIITVPIDPLPIPKL